VDTGWKSFLHFFRQKHLFPQPISSELRRGPGGICVSFLAVVIRNLTVVFFPETSQALLFLLAMNRPLARTY
jgi:hypothetical protein